jgi:hypothetical protein
MSTMYKNYEEYRINLAHNRLDLSHLCTTHFDKKIKPGRNAYSIYYYRALYCNMLFNKIIYMWLKYDHFITIGLKHRDFAS